MTAEDSRCQRNRGPCATFRQHAGPHTDAPNWPVFIGFAEREFKASEGEGRI